MEGLEQQLREQRNGGSTNTPETAASTVIEESVREPPAVRLRKKLPELPEFSGKRNEFRPWITQAKAKLSVDKATEPEAVQFWYIHSRLRGEALAQVSAWVDAVISTDRMTIEGLFGQLRAAYDDNDAAERASRKLNIIRQGTKSFSAFLAEFDRTLLDAGGIGWADQVKKTFLSNCLSYELQNAIVASPIPKTYKEYCTLLHTVSTNMENLRRKKNRERNPTTGSTSVPSDAPTEDVMDWEPATTTVAVARTQKAQWVSKEVLAKRKEAGRCIRCGGNGHFIRQCELLPASRPKQEKKALVATAAVEGEETEESDDSGNE
jgi:hypothetical protein